MHTLLNPLHAFNYNSAWKTIRIWHSFVLCGPCQYPQGRLQYLCRGLDKVRHCSISDLLLHGGRDAVPAVRALGPDLAWVGCSCVPSMGWLPLTTSSPGAAAAPACSSGWSVSEVCGDQSILAFCPAARSILAFCPAARLGAVPSPASARLDAAAAEASAFTAGMPAGGGSSSACLGFFADACCALGGLARFLDSELTCECDAWLARKSLSWD